MVLNKNKLYLFLFAACLSGYIWVFYNYSNNLFEPKYLQLCFIKQITNIPCPACGSTRSAIFLFNGNIKEALLINPFGVIIVVIMVLAPLWILFDLGFQRSTLFNFYNKIELVLNKLTYKAPIIILVIANWIWNLNKGL